MSLYAICAVRSLPGVTSVAAGLAVTWPQERRFVAECDPSGGDLAEWFARSDAVGLRTFLTNTRSAADSVPITSCLQDLFQPGRDFADVGFEGSGLPALLGVLDPDRHERENSMMEDLARCLSAWDGDVIADVGRLAPMARGQESMCRCAAMLIVLARPDVAHGRSLRTRMDLLRALNSDIRLVVVGDQPYSPRELAEFSGLPLFGALPPLGLMGGPGLAASPTRKLRSHPLMSALQRLALAMTVDSATVGKARESKSVSLDSTAAVSGSWRDV